MALLPLALTQAQCTVAGTTSPPLAACRILYQSVDGNGDAHMVNGGCIVPRPRVSNAIRLNCLRALNGAWGVQTAHRAMCDNPTGAA
jgi:hypothetical protein